MSSLPVGPAVGPAPLGQPAACRAHSANAVAVADRANPQRALATLNDDGSRRWLTPRPSPGRFLTRRRVVAYGLIALFTALPYITINGRPAILLDLTTRRFHILGATFLPTDTLPLALLVLSVFVGIFLATAIAGRVWCGWACPQTVYMEFLYRPIERLFEGRPGRAKKGAFQGSPLARVLKYATFLLVSCYLAHTFLAYFVGVENLREWVTRSPLEHPTPFIVMAAVTGLMMFDFSFFREQTCLVACPYGRFQSVLLDRHSLVVSYDHVRGEPRGKAARAKASSADVALPVLAPEATTRGDCVDCKMCVTTCPTGIDIRNGLQMECIHCAQCIDACDAVMSKIGKPAGLIRYSSQAVIAGQPTRFLRPRVFIYPVILASLLTGLAVAVGARGESFVNVVRGRGAPFVVLPDGMIGNPVKIKVVNRRADDATFTFALAPGQAGEVRAEDARVTLKSGEMRTIPAMIAVPMDAFRGGVLEGTIVVTNDHGFARQRTFRLIGPAGPALPAGQGSMPINEVTP